MSRLKHGGNKNKRVVKDIKAVLERDFRDAVFEWKDDDFTPKASEHKKWFCVVDPEELKEELDEKRGFWRRMFSEALYFEKPYPLERGYHCFPFWQPKNQERFTVRIN